VEIREGVRGAYSAAAADPTAEHPFPIGRRFATSLGYPQHLLEELPAECVGAFTGVSNVSVTAEIELGQRVLDLGCGAGLDSLIAGRRVGRTGSVVGVDFSEEMLRRAKRAGVEVLLGAAERLPLRSASIDVALVNGVFNLSPARDSIFGELARVVRPGGSVFAAELVRKDPAPPSEPEPGDDWFA
jgi:arsenite methyltransferase